MISAVIAAIAERNVIYSKRLKTLIDSFNDKKYLDSIMLQKLQILFFPFSFP